MLDMNMTEKLYPHTRKKYQTQVLDTQYFKKENKKSKLT